VSVAPPAAGAPESPGWAAVAEAFAALGRVVLLLDPELRVVRASAQLDRLLCPGSAARVLGKPAATMLGSRLFEAGGEVHRALSAGRRVEGRRAFIKCPMTGAQLVSASLAPLAEDVGAPLHPRTRFMVVIRPADEVAVPPGVAPRHGLMVRSQAMLRVVALIEALEASEANVLITGETGTGKGAVAEAIHAHSPRRHGPFVTVDASAIPAELLESELFGHVRGAFTGAHRDRTGHVELARGGTLFLDEIGDMPLPMQSKLLRLVEEREFRRLGDSTPRPMDARVISATHVDLRAAIAAGRFREDLYYRLCVVPVDLPPLRERAEEIEPLAHHLLERVSAATGRALALGADALEALLAYPWPGNVRQLDNALEHAVALCRGQTLHREDLPLEVRDHRPGAWPLAAATAPPAPPPRAPTLTAGTAGAAGTARAAGAATAAGPPEPPPPVADPEAARVLAALEAHRWNRTAAAAALGVSRTTLWRWMQRLGLA